MRLNSVLASSLALFAMLFLHGHPRATLAAEATPAKPHSPLIGGVDYFEASCAEVGITVMPPKSTPPTLIGQVRLGTPAYYAGVRKGDKILEGKVGNSFFDIKIERDGKTFQARLPLDLAALRGHMANTVAKEQSKIDKSALPAVIDEARLNSMTESEAAKILKQYDIALVIDRSGSMQENDPACDGVSKWQWCQERSSHLAGLFDDNRITLVLFNHTYELRPNCSAMDVENAFNTYGPQGLTDLSDAVIAALDEHKASKPNLPCVMAILTDGMPNRGPRIDDVIIDATKTLTKPTDLVMTFIQVGSSGSATALLDELDNHLVFNGAKYDVVHTLYFDQVKSMGLAKAMLTAINEAAKQALRQ